MLKNNSENFSYHFLTLSLSPRYLMKKMEWYTSIQNDINLELLKNIPFQSKEIIEDYQIDYPSFSPKIKNNLSK